MKTVTAVIAFAALSSCSTYVPRNLDAEPTRGLCARYGDVLREGNQSGAAEIRSALERRQLALTAADDSAIARSAIRVGMTECAMFAGWGLPDRANNTTTASGTRTQHVWSYIRYVRSARYAYTENGRVVAIQN